MTALRIQGVIFSVMAVITAGTSLLFPRLNPQTELIIMSVLIVALGVPHGALDTIFARNIYNTRSPAQWLLFAVAYLCLALVVVGIWLVSPLIFLSGFLLISLAHFSGDLRKGTPVVFQMFYGGAILVLPVILHAGEVKQLFTQLVGSQAATTVAAVLQLLSWPWLIACCLAAAVLIAKDRYTAIEIASVVGLAVTAPPLIAFTVFFCTMHSARHVLRTLKFAETASPMFLALAAAVPMLAVLGLSLAGWKYLPQSSLDSRILQFIFVGLAALTVPHMALIEQARLSGWLKAEANG